MKILLVIFIYLFNIIACDANGYNLYEPVEYFTNQTDSIDELKNALNAYGIAYITGASGVGKTETVKKYFNVYKDNYDIIGYFYGNASLKPQFISFARYINSNIEGSDKILLSSENIEDNIIQYLNTKGRWLLIFDNLNDEYKEITKFMDLKGRGHFIFISNKKQNKDYQIVINNLSVEHVEDLIKKIVKAPDEELSQNLSKALVQKGCPTALIVDSIYFLTNNTHYTVEEYIDKISKKNEMIANHLKIAMDRLSPESKILLMQISLLNNQEISKNIISKIVSNSNDLNKILDELLNTNLVKMINSDRKYPIFRLHDIYKHELLKFINNKEFIIEELITSINKAFPDQFKYGNEIHNIFSNDKTFNSNIEMLIKNIESYDIKPNYNVLELRLNALINSFELSFMSEADKHILWFKKIFLNQSKLPSNSREKKLFSTFLVHTAASDLFIYANSNEALNHLFLAQEIINNTDNNNDLKSYINIDIAQAKAYSGDLDNAKKHILEAEKLAMNNVNAKIKILFVKSLVHLMEGNYNQALSELMYEIQLCRNAGDNEEWPAVTGQKAKILNNLGRFKEAYIDTYNLYYNKYYLLQNNETDEGDILTQLSRAELGLGMVNEALKHAKLSVNLFLTSLKRNNTSINSAHDVFLAEALVVYADALEKSDNSSKALKEYSKAERIYRNVYRNNFIKNDNVTYLFLQAAKVAYRLRDSFWYKHYNDLIRKSLPVDNFRIKELDEYIKV